MTLAAAQSLSCFFCWVALDDKTLLLLTSRILSRGFLMDLPFFPNLREDVGCPFQVWPEGVWLSLHRWSWEARSAFWWWSFCHGMHFDEWKGGQWKKVRGKFPAHAPHSWSRRYVQSRRKLTVAWGHSGSPCISATLSGSVIVRQTFASHFLTYWQIRRRIFPHSTYLRARVYLNETFSAFENYIRVLGCSSTLTLS